MLRTDYHTHTPLCRHAQGEPEEFVAQAIALGMHSYGIADHAPMPVEREPFDDWRMLSSELNQYFAWVERARAASVGSNLNILCGLECDWVPGISDHIKELRRAHQFDYLIGSVHYLPTGGAVDDSVYANKSLTGSVEEDWELYWDAVLQMINSGLFDIVGHIDIVKIWGRIPNTDLMRYYNPVLDALQAGRMAVEINTAGIHKHCAELYPSAPLLRELLKRRIPIVIDSDAHYPQHLSRGWEDALKLLQQLSDTEIHQFEHLSLSGTPLLAYGSF